MKLRRNQNAPTWRMFFLHVDISDFPRGEHDFIAIARKSHCFCTFVRTNYAKQKSYDTTTTLFTTYADRPTPRAGGLYRSGSR